MHDADSVARAAVEAVRAQGHRVLLSPGWADLALADDQEGCFAVGEVNHHALFPRVAAVVHHGGAGTTTTAALAGAPQVVVPQLADQPYWPGRVADLGIGAAHDGPNPTFESLSAALGVVLATETEPAQPLWQARSAPTARRWPRSCCSTRSVEIDARQGARHLVVRPDQQPDLWMPAKGQSWASPSHTWGLTGLGSGAEDPRRNGRLRGRPVGPCRRSGRQAHGGWRGAFMLSGRSRKSVKASRCARAQRRKVRGGRPVTFSRWGGSGTHQSSRHRRS
ncbi:hypothetical protein SGLAM104S_04864 [Streptomyces glaucescens]